MRTITTLNRIDGWRRWRGLIALCALILIACAAHQALAPMAHRVAASPHGHESFAPATHTHAGTAALPAVATAEQSPGRRVPLPDDCPAQLAIPAAQLLLLLLGLTVHASASLGKWRVAPDTPRLLAWAHPPSLAPAHRRALLQVFQI